jgi:hypothetical protein
VETREYIVVLCAGCTSPEKAERKADIRTTNLAIASNYVYKCNPDFVLSSWCRDISSSTVICPAKSQKRRGKDFLDASVVY